MALALFLCIQVGCRAPEQAATVQPTLPVDALPATATVPSLPLRTGPPTVAPTRPRATSTLVPLVTRTRAPTITPAPTRVPGSLRCTTVQPAGTEGPVWDIEVAPDGTVWVVTFRGLARLHPVRKEWIAVTVEVDPEAHVGVDPGAEEGEDRVIDQFRTVTAGSDGSVWLATRFGDGVFAWDGTLWTQLTSDDGLISDWVNEVSPGPDGTVWFATREGVSRWDAEAGTWTQYSGPGWLHDDLVHRVLFTPDGSIWFAHDRALTRWRPTEREGGSDLWEVTSLDGPFAVRKALTSADGRLWLAQLFYDPGTDEWTDTVYRDIHVQGLAVDGEGGLWIARSDGALYIPEPASSGPRDWFHLGQAQGLGGDSVTAIAVERDDLVWFGTEQGVTKCTIEGLR